MKSIFRHSFETWSGSNFYAMDPASMERMLDLSQVFRRRVLASRIPEIVRAPDSSLGNRTILETLRAGGVDSIYPYLGQLFSYGGI